MAFLCRYSCTMVRSLLYQNISSLNTRRFTEKSFDEDNLWNKHDDSFDTLVGTEGKIAIGGKRFVSVDTFMGKKYISIREFFEKDGEIKPTSKGITLRMAEWRELKNNIDLIEEKIERF